MYNECINIEGKTGNEAVGEITRKTTNDESNDSDMKIGNDYNADTVDADAKHDIAVVESTTTKTKKW